MDRRAHGDPRAPDRDATRRPRATSRFRPREWRSRRRAWTRRSSTSSSSPRPRRTCSSRRTGAIVAEEIGATKAAGYDTLAACSGFLYGVSQAYGTIVGGVAEKALVIGSETLSKIVNWNDRGTCILFGDGAGAAVLEPVEQGGFLGFELGVDATHGGDLCLPAGGSRTPATPETARERPPLGADERPRGLPRGDAAHGLLGGGAARARSALTIDDVDLYVAHQANQRIIDHAAKHLGLPPEKVFLNIERYGNTSAASIPIGLAEAVESGRLEPGMTVLMSAVGGGHHVGLRRARRGPERGLGVRLAFCFPGQGSQAVGMGREMAEAFPEARAVYDEGSEAVGFDLARVCFEGPLEELTRTEVQQPALVATSLACLRGVESTGLRARRRRRPLGRRVLGARRVAVRSRRGTRWRSSAPAASGDRRGRRGPARRDGGGDRARRRGRGGALRRDRATCGPRTTTAPASSSSPARPTRSTALIELAPERGARKTVKLPISGAFHSPLVGRARRAARARRRARSSGASPSPPFMSTVTAELEGAERASRHPPRPADCARPLHAGGPHARRARAWTRSSRSARGRCSRGLLRRCDRSVTTISVGDPDDLAKLDEVARAVPDFCSLEGKRRARHRRLARDRRRRSAASSPRAGARVAVNYRASADAAESARAGDRRASRSAGTSPTPSRPSRARRSRSRRTLGDLDIVVNNAGITRDTLLARMSDEDWQRRHRRRTSTAPSTRAARSPGRCSAAARARS